MSIEAERVGTITAAFAVIDEFSEPLACAEAMLRDVQRVARGFAPAARSWSRAAASVTRSATETASRLLALAGAGARASENLRVALGSVADRAVEMRLALTRSADAFAPLRALSSETAASWEKLGAAVASSSALLDSASAKMANAADAAKGVASEVAEIAASAQATARAATAASAAISRVPRAIGIGGETLPSRLPRSSGAVDEALRSRRPRPRRQVFERPGTGGVPGLTGLSLPDPIGNIAFKGLVAEIGGAGWILDEAGRVSDMGASLARRSVRTLQVASATAVTGRVAPKIPGATSSAALAAFIDPRAVHGNGQEALVVRLMLLRDTMAFAGRGLGGDASIPRFIKALDVQSALNQPHGKLSPEKAAETLQAAEAAMVTLPGLLKSAMLLPFVQTADLRIQNPNLQGLLRGHVELPIGPGNRSRRSTGMAFLKRLDDRLTTSRLRSFDDLDLISRKDVGGIQDYPFFDPDELNGARILRNQGLVAWEERVLSPAIEKKFGRLDVDAIERVIARLSVPAQRMLVGAFATGQQIRWFGGLFNQTLRTNLPKPRMSLGSANVRNFDSASQIPIRTLAAREVLGAINILRDLAEVMRGLGGKSINSRGAGVALAKRHVQLPSSWPPPAQAGATRTPSSWAQSADRTNARMAPVGAPEPSITLPLPPPAARQMGPSIPTITVNAPVHVTVAMPQLDGADIQAMIESAMIAGLSPEMIRTVATLIATTAGDQITNRVAQSLSRARRNAVRGSMIDRGNTATRVNLGEPEVGFGGL